MGGAAQLAFEFQHNALLRDVEREGFARNGRGDQGGGDGVQDGGREVEGGFGRFDFAGDLVTAGLWSAEDDHWEEKKAPLRKIALLWRGAGE